MDRGGSKRDPGELRRITYHARAEVEAPQRAQRRL